MSARTQDALVFCLGPTEQTEFSREFHTELAETIDRDPRAAALGPKARRYVAEHARVLAETALARVIDADDRAEAIERITAETLRGL